MKIHVNSCDILNLSTASLGGGMWVPISRHVSLTKYPWVELASAFPGRMGDMNYFYLASSQLRPQEESKKSFHLGVD